MSLRVGVLTFHRPINYGSYWQARSLVESLGRLGHTVELIDHDSPTSRLAERRISLRPTLPIVPSKEDVRAYERKIRGFDEAICGLPLSRTVPLERLNDLDPYDVVVVGSDEVWNLRHPLFGGRVPFFGVGLPARRIVSYAASFGNYSCWDGLPKPWPELVERFDAVSVRDENSWWMLKHALGREVPLVLDPCLLASIPGAGPNPIAGTPYVVVYGHNFSESYARRTRAWADREGVRLVSVGYRNDWAHEQFLELKPEDFPRVISAAKAVATNFFHGCVFALSLGRPFTTEATEYRSIKVRGLLEAVRGEAHFVTAETSEEAFERTMSSPISGEILGTIVGLREDSFGYLNEALG